MSLTVNTSELFNLKMSWEATDIAEEVYKRAICDATDIDEGYESLADALNDELIYSQDQWTIMKEYQSPEEANYDEAYMMFYDDLATHYYEIIEEQGAE